jgi:membrane protease subunit (stomatin/prohibitin family)
MALIQFVRNYDDLSSDRGYQFKFHCDKCGNGFMTQYETSTIGMAESVLNAAGSLLGGWGYSAGNAAHEVERAVGGKMHDAALARAVEEARPNFRQCGRCGHWVCLQVCWNPNANLCSDCAPDFNQQLAANQAQAKAEAARMQLDEKARQTNYVGGVDMSANSYVAAPIAASNTQAPKSLCGQCGADVGAAKFCPECGKPVVRVANQFCPQCGAESQNGKFCRNCGTKLTP